jgi:hypothetical protein
MAKRGDNCHPFLLRGVTGRGHARADAKLRLAQEEVEQMARMARQKGWL